MSETQNTNSQIEILQEARSRVYSWFIIDKRYFFVKSSNEEIRHGLALYSDNEVEWERVKSCASEGDLLR